MSDAQAQSCSELNGRPAGLLGWLGLPLEDFRRVRESRHVLWNLVNIRLTVRYHRSLLGFLWSLLNPLLTLSVLALVFSQLLEKDLKVYAIYLFSGRVPWSFFSELVNTGGRSMISAEGMIKKVRLPCLIFPLQSLLVSLTNFVLSLVALLILSLLIRPELPIQLVMVPLAIVLLAIFSFGFILLLTTLTTYFRDLEHITSVFLRAWFFLSPILYSPERLKGHAYLLYFNPMTYYLELFHDAIHYGRWSSPHVVGMAAALAFGMLFIGYVAFKSKERDFVYRL